MNRQQAFLLTCIALSAVAAFVVVLPFVEYVLAAAVLAYLLMPLHGRLTPRVGQRASSALLILGSFVVAVTPLAYVGSSLYSDLRLLARGRIDLQVDAVEAELARLLGVDVSLEPVLTAAGREGLNLLTGSVGGVFATAMHTSLGMALLVFLVYYGLRDGPQFVEWTKANSPLPRGVSEDLYEQIEQTTWGVVIGHIFVAVLQGIVGGIGLWAAGIPKVAFWTFVMIVLGLLPLIGAFAVWGSAAVYLAVVGDAGNALFLAVYGVLVVSTLDNFVRPIVIDKRADLNPGLILLGVFGGVYVLGFVGLFVGPILLGILTATVVTFAERYDELVASPEPTGPVAGEATPGTGETTPRTARTTAASEALPDNLLDNAPEDVRGDLPDDPPEDVQDDAGS